MTNVTQLPDAYAKTALDTVLQELESWRNTKESHQQVSIPVPLWRKILALKDLYPATKIRRSLGISKAQYDKKLAELYPSEVQSSQEPPVDFCQAKPTPAPSAVKHVPHYEEVPRYIGVNTVIVEFCRADGKIMKIHTTSHCFKEIIDAFYTGAADVTGHPKA